MSSFFLTNFEGNEDERKNKIKGFDVISYEDVSKCDLQEDLEVMLMNIFHISFQKKNSKNRF